MLQSDAVEGGGGTTRLSPSPSSSSNAATAVTSPRATPLRLFRGAAGAEKENGATSSPRTPVTSSRSAVTSPRVTSATPRGTATPSRGGGAASGGAGGSEDHSVSIYDDPVGTGSGVGSKNKVARIQFNLKYNDSTLTLKIIRAIDLPVMDYMTGTSDPYVKVSLRAVVYYHKNNQIKVKLGKVSNHFRFYFIF